LLGFEIEAPYYYCFGLTGGLRRRERALEARYLTTAAMAIAWNLTGDALSGLCPASTGSHHCSGPELK
jgi:hypothetical protein